mmetsp:Transcript_53377/g.116378  ORF Transcript_53377/g.116378 Transcript_53377/m.116378 type:complete len:97 (+) Transcript_53377:133-423(+)
MRLPVLAQVDRELLNRHLLHLPRLLLNELGRHNDAAGGAGGRGDGSVGRPCAPWYNSNGLRCARYVSTMRLRLVAFVHFSSSNQSAYLSQQDRQQP